MRRMRPTTARGPRVGVVGSILFHGLIVAAMFVTLQRNFKAPEETHVVPVDLVTIADQTNVAAQAPPAPEPEKMDAPQPVLEPPPEPQMQEVEPAPDTPMPKFEVEKEKPKPVEKPVEKPKKDPAMDFNALLNKLTAPDKPVKAAKPGPKAIQGIGAGTAMTADLRDALSSQIYRCWSPPVGAPRASDLVVDFDLSFNPDGTVARATSPSVDPGNPNSYNRAAGIAARTAIYACAPYRLPADRYAQWREVGMHFDPRQMMGQ